MKLLFHKFMYRYFWDHPSKYLIQKAFKNYTGPIQGCATKAHSWTFDSTCTSLEEVATIHRCTRERVRQCLCKFYRTYK